MKTTLKLQSQYELLKTIRKQTLPASRKHKSIKDYNRSKFKKELD
jgi:hypothetical protein